MLSIYSLALFAAGAQAVLTLQSPRFTVSSSDGSQLRSEPYAVTSSHPTDKFKTINRISLLYKPSTPVTLSNSDTFKVTFQVLEKESGNGVQPHQTFIRFYDEKTGEEGVQPIRVTSGGKAKFELVRSLDPWHRCTPTY